MHLPRVYKHELEASVGVGATRPPPGRPPESLVGGRSEAVCGPILTNATLFLVLQIGNLENYYHFYHSKTFKRSTLSSRGPHTFLRMDPQVPDPFLAGRLLFVAPAVLKRAESGLSRGSS